jgi:hypothetical protein
MTSSISIRQPILHSFIVLTTGSPGITLAARKRSDEARCGFRDKEISR